MFDLLIRIYSKDDYQIKGHRRSYRAMFGVMPRVGDYITQHIEIDDASDCQVKKIYIIPKANIDTTDVDAVIEAIECEKINLD